MRPLVICAVLALPVVATADETSTGDKLRILYSSRLSFGDRGMPLVTVEIMSDQPEVRLGAVGGLVVRPDGSGASAIEAQGGTGWIVTAENTQPAVVREWTVVETLAVDDAVGVQKSLETWKGRGLEARAFEVGTMFGVDGEVIDTRDVLIGIDPVPAPGGAARAREHAKKWSVSTQVHRELVRRPSGTIVAKNGTATVKNPSVIWFEAANRSETIAVENVPTGTGGSQLTTGRERRRYWGSVYVTLGLDGDLVAVNAVSEDKLLAGLVPAEIFPEAPDAALEAQAIAARTELLAKIGRRNTTDPFVLCSSQQCQVYAGAGHEHPRTTRAVEKTRGTVVLRDGGGLMDARYSAACGGHSEHNDSIWGGAPDPSLRGHPDGENMSPVTDIDAFLKRPAEQSWCGRTRHGKGRFRWSSRLSVEDASTRIAQHYPQVGRVLALEPLSRGVSGRIRSLRIRGKSGIAIAEGDLHIRRLLGGLKSTLFKITIEGPSSAPSAFVFDGAGFGHGVGLCQVGAIGMAEQGKSHGEILRHYYPGTHLHRLY